MTRKEAIRQTHQDNTLIDLGFTRSEAESLRRISMTLHRWHERECGDGNSCIVRGTWNPNDHTLDYDSGPNGGRPYLEVSGTSGRNRYIPIPDRETGARKRLDTIVNARNVRAVTPGSSHTAVGYYIQGDPRGAALYIIRPGDVPERGSLESYYDRGICIY